MNFKDSLLADGLLARLFQRHFDDPVAALHSLEKHLTKINLPFDFKAQLRELKFPPQPDFPSVTPIVYYFVPDTKRGTDQQIKIDEPLHPSFINAADGIGLNLGCPVRLLRALVAFENLNANDQQSRKAALCDPRGHLSAVEELLWLNGWKSMSNPRNGGQFEGMTGDVDWAFEARGIPVYLEAKFRRSDWPRLSDDASFSKMKRGFLSKALHKFPNLPYSKGLHVVGITMFDNITKDILNAVGHELEAAPQIHAVVFRSLLQMTHVISLDLAIRDYIFGLLAVPAIKDYPANHVVIFDRAQRDKRLAQTDSKPQTIGKSKAFCWPIKPAGDDPPPSPIPDLYRISINNRMDDGEPIFEVIPKWLSQ